MIGMMTLQLTTTAQAQSPPGALDEVIVTARRTEEPLQEVPISIAVYDQQQLADRNVLSARDLATFTPSLSANSRFGTESTSFAIRGFTQENRTTASVAAYFADVVAPRGGGGFNAGDGAGPGSFFDLQNVQVLKGPQGTLFGRNTTGGAILLVPHKPEYDFGGYVEGSYGNFDMQRAQAVLNAPLSDRVRLRLGVDQMKREGYLKNTSGIGPSRLGDVDYLAGRVSLVVDVTPNIENYTIASMTSSDNHGAVAKLFACNPANVPIGALACGQLARANAASDDFYAVQNGMEDPRTRMDQWQIINTTTWTATDTLTLKNIASYAELTNKVRNDTFGSAWVIPSTFLGRPTGALAGSVTGYARNRYAPGLSNSDQSTMTEELQLSGRAWDSRLVWQAGAYFEQSKPLDTYGQQNPSLLSCTDSDNFQCTDVLGILLGRQGRLGSLGYQVSETSFRNLGVYSQATYELTDTLTLTGGIRYTSDRTESMAQKVTYRFPQPNTPVGFCISPLVRNPALPITSPTDCREEFRKTSNAPTWLIGLDYKPIDDVLLYGKYSRGYRQGSTNPFAADGYNTFDPEQVDTYELGAKTSFETDSVRGTFNIAAFYNDFTDQQVQIGFNNSTGAVAGNVGILNAGKSRIYGAEVDSSITLFEDLRIDASYAYLNSKLEELEQVTFTPGSLYDIAVPSSRVGSRLALTPTNKASLTATYTLPLPETAGRLSVSSTYSYTGDMLTSTATPFGVLDSYKVVSASVNWKAIADSRVDVSLFATNLTDEEYFVYVAGIYNTLGFESATLSEPRMYGVRVNVRFGE
jgi:iron complex outermembrane receptor protein